MTNTSTSVMNDWAGEQRAWIQALRDPGQTVPWSDWQGGRRDAASAGAIYINNIRANVINALSLSYPAVLKILGPQHFAQLVVEGLRRTPPSSGDLSGYGGWLPQMLSEDLKRESVASGCPSWSQQSGAEDVAWLATLEWSVDQARNQDSPPAWTWADASQDMLSSDWMTAFACLRPPWQTWPLSHGRMALLFQTAHDMNAEWPTQAPSGTDSASPDLLDLSEAPVALIQQGRRLMPVQAEDLAWLKALGNGVSFESATQQVLCVHPGWQPDTVLHMCLSHGLLCRFRWPADTPCA